MAVKIRLQRHGKKGKPFYWIVAADSRSKRDGKYLEKIGTYDPNQKPAAIDLNFDSALSWLEKGAQPTNTAKTILSYTGVLLKKHLDGGVKKGAFTEAEAKKRFDKWMKEKSSKIEKKIEDMNASLESNKKEAMYSKTGTQNNSRIAHQARTANFQKQSHSQKQTKQNNATQARQVN